MVLAAISSAIVSRWFLGDEPLFRVPQYHLEHVGELAAYAVLGVIGGLASIVFVKYIAFLRPRLKRLPAWTHRLQPAVAGLIIGLIGLRYPQIMGAGYTYIDQAMHEQFTWQVLLILGGLKIFRHRAVLQLGNAGRTVRAGSFHGSHDWRGSRNG